MYRIVKYVKGSWKTVQKFEELDDAQVCYKNTKNGTGLIGLMAEPPRKMGYMVERSDWD